MVNISLGYFKFLNVDGLTCRRKVDYNIQGMTPMAIIVYSFSNYVSKQLGAIQYFALPVV